MKKIIFSLLLTSITAGYAAFQLTPTTNGSGNFTKGSWTESGTATGTVTPNYIALGTPTTLITGFSGGGVLNYGTIGSIAGNSNRLRGATYSGSNITNSDVVTRMSINFNNANGTANIGALNQGNVSLTNFGSGAAAVNSFTVDFTYGYSTASGGGGAWLSAQRGGPASTAPFLAGLRGSNASSTLRYDVTAQFIDAVHFSPIGGTAPFTLNNGLPSTGQFVAMSNNTGFGTWSGPATSHSWQLTNASFQGVNSYDVNGGGVTSITNNSLLTDNTLQEIEAVAARGIRFTVRRNDGMNFTNTAQFLFSFTGQQSIQSQNITAIPEPSTSALTLLGFLSLLMVRKRR